MEKAAHSLWEKAITLFIVADTSKIFYSEKSVMINTENHDSERKPVGKYLLQVNYIGISKTFTNIALPSLLLTLIKYLPK